MLLQARDEETGQAMSDTQIRDEIITLLIAGHETVASALTWTWYLLSLHPAVRARLKNEVDTVLGIRPPTSADLPNLPYTAQVFSEALRLFPPAWVITRHASGPDMLDGYEIPAGALVILSPYALHRHPEFWPNPEGFDPERFVPGNPPARFSYIPFGGGPRLCIGNTFAQIEASLILARLTQYYRLDLIPGEKVQVDALVTLRPHGGLRMRLAAGK
jgi:cytochrome P450